MAALSFDPVAYINEPRWQESRLGLERIRELLERLGRPQDAVRFVHVAGTNGKGSTCAYLASVLQVAGYRTGLFTSPCVEVFEDRIRVNGQNIPHDDLVEATLEVKVHADAMEAETGDHPTEYELLTAVALLHFKRSSCDIAVLEVGLGGRLDSTNAIDAPEVAAIARIGLDHTALLGTTLAAIAGEKAAIIKPGAAVVSYPQEPEAMAVVEEDAREAGAVLRVPDFAQLAAEPFALESSEALGTLVPSGAIEALAENVSREAFARHTMEGEEGHGAFATDKSPVVAAPAAATTFDQNVSREAFVRTFSYGEYRRLATRLLGSYQPMNAALAIEIVEALRGRGWSIPDEAVREGIARTAWPGRFEVVARDPLFVVDGGHNPQGACALADTLRDVAPNHKAIFIIGVLADKDYPAMLEAVLPLGDAFITVAPDNPRALSAAALARAIRWTGQDMLGCSACLNVQVARDMDDAVRRAYALAGNAAGQGSIIVAFGSLYSVAAAKAAVYARDCA